jgi:hypothetical protein
MTRSIYTDPQPSDFGIERLLEPEEIDQLTVAEYREYERKLRNYRDWKNTIVTAKKMAYERGFKEGMAEKLKERNVPIEEIIERTGLTEQEIAAL